MQTGVLKFRHAAISALASIACYAQPDKPLTPQPTVVFVCEHGAAKSVIAAAWFNKLAAERHLPFHAIARGTTPQEELSQSTVAGLRRDGAAFPSDRPRALTEQEAKEAVRVVAFCPLPEPVKPQRVDSFEVPAPMDGYAQARDAILSHVEALLDDLQEQRDRVSSSEFRALLETVARGWNTGNARLAADCFTEDAVYSSPPSTRIRRGRDELFEFFGGVKGRPKPMHMQWHNIVFDETAQLGMGEYTFSYEIRTHGVAVIRIRNGKVANWREYELESPLDWDRLVGPNHF